LGRDDTLRYRNTRANPTGKRVNNAATTKMLITLLGKNVLG